MLNKIVLKRVLIALVVALLAAGYLGYIWFNQEKPTLKLYPKKPLTVLIDWEISKPFELQIYYTTEQDKVFSSKYLVKRKVTPEDKHVEVVIPEDKIYRFRIDFGRNPEKVVLKNVEIIADQYINFNDWKNYAYKNIEKSKINKEDNSLTITSTHNDPYMFWSIPFVLYKNK